MQSAEEESYFKKGEIEIDKSYFGAGRVRGKRGREAGGKIKISGLKKHGEKVYTKIIISWEKNVSNIVSKCIILSKLIMQKSFYLFYYCQTK